MINQSDRSLVLWVRIGACAAPLAGLTYVFGFWVNLGGQSHMWFSLGFPPTLLLACIALVSFIGRGRTSPALQIALVCSALAVGTFLIMITVQSTLRVTLLEDVRGLNEGQTKVAAQYALRAMNQTQLAFDVAWDVWISMATVAFGLGMLGRAPSLFDRLAGGYGILAGITGLTINLFVFPVPPANAGLPDPGVFFFIWFGIVGLSMTWIGCQSVENILTHLYRKEP